MYSNLLYRISTFQDDKEGPTWDDVTATVWKALEEMPDSNNEYLETLKPYPARLPTMDEVLSTLIPQDISNDFISTGYEVMGWYETPEK